MGGGLGMGLGWVFALLMVVGVAIVVMVVVRAVRGGFGAKATTAPEAGNALEVLQGRYARGEISTQEYQERRGHLEEGS